MQIAYTTGPGKGDTDLLLYRLAETLAAEGVRLCGTVQFNTDRPDCAACDMDVKILPYGPVVRISQSLGREARGCRLDPAALESAVAAAEAQLDGGADALIVNKFGKHEADGRGFRGVIAEALSLGLPVLVGLNGQNVAAFREFTGGAAVELAPDAAVLAAWLRDAVTAGPDAA